MKTKDIPLESPIKLPLEMQKETFDKISWILEAFLRK